MKSGYKYIFNSCLYIRTVFEANIKINKKAYSDKNNSENIQFLKNYLESKGWKSQ